MAKEFRITHHGVGLFLNKAGKELRFSRVSIAEDAHFSKVGAILSQLLEDVMEAIADLRLEIGCDLAIETDAIERRNPEKSLQQIRARLPSHPNEGVESIIEEIHAIVLDIFGAETEQWWEAAFHMAGIIEERWWHVVQGKEAWIKDGKNLINRCGHECENGANTLIDRQIGAGPKRGALGESQYIEGNKLETLWQNELSRSRIGGAVFFVCSEDSDATIHKILTDLLIRIVVENNLTHSPSTLEGHKSVHICVLEEVCYRRSDSKSKGVDTDSLLTGACGVQKSALHKTGDGLLIDLALHLELDAICLVCIDSCQVHLRFGILKVVAIIAPESESRTASDFENAKVSLFASEISVEIGLEPLAISSSMESSVDIELSGSDFADMTECGALDKARDGEEEHIDADLFFGAVICELRPEELFTTDVVGTEERAFFECAIELEVLARSDLGTLSAIWILSGEAEDFSTSATEQLDCGGECTSETVVSFLH